MRSLTILSCTWAVCALFAWASASHADVVLSTFDDGDWGNGVTGLTGTYVDWDSAMFTQNPFSFEVDDTTQFGGAWFTLPNPFLNGTANGEDKLSLTIDIKQDNQADGINVVLFDANGTQAGFAFDITGLTGSVNLMSDLLNPSFFNAGDINTWDPSQIGDQLHIQGNFANSNFLHINWEDLRTTNAIPEPASIGLMAIGALGMVFRRRR
jgi:hypothetical protein